MFSFFQWFLFLCARQHKLIRDPRLLRFQAMIANPTPSPTYGLASYFFLLFLPVMFSPSRNGYRRTCSNQDGTKLLHAGKKTLYIPIKYHYPTSHKVIKSKPNLIVESQKYTEILQLPFGCTPFKHIKVRHSE